MPDECIEFTGRNYGCKFDCCPKGLIRQDLNGEELSICQIVDDFVLAEKYKDYPNVPGKLFDLMKLFKNIKDTRKYEIESAVNHYYQKKPS